MQKTRVLALIMTAQVLSTYICLTSGTANADSAISHLSFGADPGVLGFVASDFNQKYKLNLSYTSASDSVAKSLLIQGVTHHAVVERSLRPVEVDIMLSRYRSWQYLPIQAQAFAFSMNVTDLSNRPIRALKMNDQVLTSIFTGVTMYWDDASLKLTNPNVALPHQLIQPVVSSFCSQASWMLSQFLLVRNVKAWNSFATDKGFEPNLPTCNYPSPGTVYPGTPSLSGQIALVPHQNAEGRIISVLNKTGRFTKPNKAGVSATLANVKYSSNNFVNYGSVINSKAKDAYPLIAVSYLITTVPKGYAVTPEMTSNPNQADLNEGKLLSRFLKYYACDWQAPSSGVYPLSQSMRERIYAGIFKITGHIAVKKYSNKSCKAATP